MDADGNGTVDFEEFLRFVGNKFEQTRTVRVDSVDQSAQQPPDPVEDEANKLVFNMFDKEETFFAQSIQQLLSLNSIDNADAKVCDSGQVRHAESH